MIGIKQIESRYCVYFIIIIISLELTYLIEDIKDSTNLDTPVQP